MQRPIKPREMVSLLIPGEQPQHHTDPQGTGSPWGRERGKLAFRI